MTKLKVKSTAGAAGGVYTVGQIFDHVGLAVSHLLKLAKATNVLVECLDTADAHATMANAAEVVLSEVAFSDTDHTNLKADSDSPNDLYVFFTATSGTKGWTWKDNKNSVESNTYNPQKPVLGSTLIRDIFEDVDPDTEFSALAGLATVCVFCQDPANEYVYGSAAANDATLLTRLTNPVEFCRLTVAIRDFGE